MSSGRKDQKRRYGNRSGRQTSACCDFSLPLFAVACRPSRKAKKMTLKILFVTRRKKHKLPTIGVTKTRTINHVSEKRVPCVVDDDFLIEGKCFLNRIVRVECKYGEVSQEAINAQRCEVDLLVCFGCGYCSSTQVKNIVRKCAHRSSRKIWARLSSVGT
jgi:hypothetical protein